ncbi:unnamed protein product [Mytilus coruscus]|uniref:LRAT domain-containing protein n=1 Tax=Mytilus coruscus TaxID=42192 RepID=A0A6J8CT88_MYTCO|nr:unnamed protein product [Mytilus coruscus]
MEGNIEYVYNEVDVSKKYDKDFTTMSQISNNESTVVADSNQVDINEHITTTSQSSNNESTVVADSNQVDINEHFTTTSQSNNDESTVADSNQVIIIEQTLKEKIIKSCDVEVNDELRSVMNARTRHIVTNIENIKVGSEISYGRWGYKHHAVVVEVDPETDKYKIIHLSGDSNDSSKASSSSGDGKAKPKSEWMTMTDTKKDKSFYYDYKTDGTAISFESDVIIGRAEALMKAFSGSAGMNYHLRKFNCQHFASYCVTGVPYCKPYNKMLCCCKRGTAINCDFKKILDNQLKGKKTPSPEKEGTGKKKDSKPTHVMRSPEKKGTGKKKDSKPTHFIRPQQVEPLEFGTEDLMTNNTWRASSFSPSGLNLDSPLRKMPQDDQLKKDGIQLKKKKEKKSKTKL